MRKPKPSWNPLAWLKFNYTLGADYSHDERVEGCPAECSDVATGGRVSLNELLGSAAWAQQPQTVRIRGTLEAVDGPMLSVKYKDGEKKLVVTPETVVVTYVPGNKDDLKPGTRIFVGAAKKQPDGTLQTPRITYGRNGAGPAF